jgi:hypothetical protein
MWREDVLCWHGMLVLLAYCLFPVPLMDVHGDDIIDRESSLHWNEDATYQTTISLEKRICRIIW